MARANLNDPAVAADYDLIYADREAAVDGIERLLVGYLPVQPGGALLDASCGSAITSQAAARLGFTVTGVDASPAMVERARRLTSGVSCGSATCSRCGRPSRHGSTP
jgi:2-polyprenyl-3-methyl-5-hydroxy-6-metoxy-1,4-benzoquinol methylase